MRIQILFFGALVMACGSDSNQLEPEGQPLAGTAMGQSWTFSAGQIRDGLSDSVFVATLHQQAVEACGLEQAPGIHLALQFPKELGAYDINAETTIRFVSDAADNMAVEGNIVVLDVRDDLVVASIFARYDDNNEVDGIFEIARCPADEEACSGTATSCEQLSFCDEQLGCSDAPGTCSGEPVACGAIGYDISCFNQPGCRWSFDSRFCYSEVDPCEGRLSDSCEPQCVGCVTGCSFRDGGCMGSAMSCEQFSEANDCNNQAGCAWP